MVSESALDVGDLIYPIFVDEEASERKPVGSMPGVERLPLSALDEEIDELKALGVPAVMLFGIPAEKDETGDIAYAPGNIIEKSVKAIERRDRDMIVMTDVCLCEYTTHGHCGPIKNNTVDNDATLDIIAKTAVNYARAGADVVAPSGMMDGMVHAIRCELDFHGFKDIIIMSYAAKYASAMYGPFREAASSGCQGFDRSTYQMDPSNADEAMREVALDLEEGADIVMVKPALSYLDIVYRVKAEFRVPVAAYSVSGEYAMIKAAAANGWIDGDRVAMEALLSMRRAGTDLIITYFAKDAARLLRGPA
jgi:porphobilinogen synthase